MNGQAQAFTEDLDESFTADSNEFQDQPEQSPPPTPQWEVPYTPPPVQQDYQQDSDDLPEWVHDENLDLQSYTRNIIEEAGKQFRLQRRLESSVARAKEVYNGRDLPAYDELVNSYALPLLAQHPDLHRLVLRQADPAAASYLIGFCAAYPHLVPQVIARKGNLDKTIFRPINFRPTIQARNSGSRQPSGKVNYENWDNAAFIDELERFKLSPEGE
jgi:hypothetical protein